MYAPFVVVDFETYYDTEITLENMTLVEYLAATWPLGFSYTTETGVKYVHYTDQNFGTVAAELTEMFDSGTVFVAHNAAFDARVWRHFFGGTLPRVHCTMEIAMYCWPNQPGGYGLDNLTSGGKNKINLRNCTREELEAYCIRDTELTAELYSRELKLIPPDELAISELCNTLRQVVFDIDQSQAASTAAAFDEIMNTESAAVALPEVFGYKDDGSIKSVKSVKLRGYLQRAFGFSGASTSMKKLNPAELDASSKRILTATSRINKSIWYKRETGKFVGRTQVHAELGYFRAHTGRFSSPAPGCKGVNLHNLPKRDKKMAKIVRSMFVLPDGWCSVSADLASVEYRYNGWQTRCLHTENVYNADVMADAYVAFWFMATGQRIGKKDAARQVAKMAVLGLGFLMALERWMSELYMALSDPIMGLKLSDFEQLVQDQGWRMPNDDYVAKCRENTNAPLAIAITAYYTHKKFHEVHPEFGKLARWMEATVTACAGSLTPERVIDRQYELPNAPDRSRLDLRVDRTLEGLSIRAACGPWVPTVSWRDIAVRKTKNRGYKITSIQSGDKGARALTQNILIENVTQAGARNAVCKAKLILRDMGYKYILSVHDEIKLIIPRNVEAVKKARADLLSVLGPGNSLGYDWAIVIDPKEIDYSRTLYAEPQPMEWWDNLTTSEL